MADGALRLSPEHALAYLHELSVDLRAGLVLGAADGALRAGPERLATPARALLDAAGAAAWIEHDTGEALVLAARGRDHALVLVLGSRVLPGLARWDLDHVLTALDGPSGPVSPESEHPSSEAERRISAAATALADAADR